MGTKVDQGSPGNQGPWPVTLDSSIIINPIPVIVNDLTATGTINTQNLNPNSGTATANSAVEISCTDRGTVTIQVTGTYTGALTPQVTTDGTNWITQASQSLLRMSNGAQSNTIPSAAQDIWQIEVAGHAKFRITALAAVTGTATVTLRATAVGPAQVLADVTPSISSNAFTESSIAVGGTQQTALAANANRKYLLFCNSSDTDMFIRFDGTNATTGSLLIRANGGNYESPANFCPTSKVSVICATAGKTYTVVEG